MQAPSWKYDNRKLHFLEHPHDIVNKMQGNISGEVQVQITTQLWKPTVAMAIHSLNISYATKLYTRATKGLKQPDDTLQQSKVSSKI